MYIYIYEYICKLKTRKKKSKNNNKFDKKGSSFSKIATNPGLKADFAQQVNKSMKSTIYKCVVNVTPVTNPTRYTKLAEYNVKETKSGYYWEFRFRVLSRFFTL